MPRQEIVGLIPAGGQASRIAPLPCSKELFPVGLRTLDEAGVELRPKVACHYLLERYRLAGVKKAFVILRQGKWDIPAYLGSGSLVDIHLAYLMMNLPHGTPYTLDQAYPFVSDALIVFGFPDILFTPEDSFVQLLSRQKVTGADITLGLFVADHPENMDMVDFDEHGHVSKILIKPKQTHLRYTWIIAVWTPAFTEFMHTYLQKVESEARMNISSTRRELFVGHVIQAAIDAGLQVDHMIFPHGDYIDIGTPDHLVRALRNQLSTGSKSNPS